MTSPIPPQVSLRAFREVQGITLADLAELIKEQGHEVTADGLNNVELGHKQGSEALMIAWARALGIKRIHVRQASELREWLMAGLAEPVRSAA